MFNIAVKGILVVGIVSFISGLAGMHHQVVSKSPGSSADRPANTTTAHNNPSGITMELGGLEVIQSRSQVARPLRKAMMDTSQSAKLSGLREIPVNESILNAYPDLANLDYLSFMSKSTMVVYLFFPSSPSTTEVSTTEIHIKNIGNFLKQDVPSTVDTPEVLDGVIIGDPIFSWSSKTNTNSRSIACISSDIPENLSTQLSKTFIHNG